MILSKMNIINVILNKISYIYLNILLIIIVPLLYLITVTRKIYVNMFGKLEIMLNMNHKGKI